MSTERDLPRLVGSREPVRSVLREAFDAERVDGGPDAERLRRMTERFLQFADNEPRFPTPPRKPRRSPPSWIGIVVGISSLSVVTVGVAMSNSSDDARRIASTESSRDERPEVRTLGASSVDASSGTSAPIEPSVAGIVTQPRQEAALGAPEKLPPERGVALPAATAHANTAPSRAKSVSGASAVVVDDSAEISLLARAHEALHDRPDETLGLCQKHQSEFPRGHFAQERDALVIQALVHLQRTDEAQRRLDDFRRRYPSSGHRIHLEDLVSAATSENR